MRIVCPACDAAYQVPDDLPTRAPEVRCVRCGHSWKPAGAAAPTPAPMAAPIAAPLPAPVARPPAPPDPSPAPPPPPSPAPAPRGLRLAWLLSLLLLAGFGAAAVAWRAPLVDAWPPLGRVFAALGLNP